MEGARKILKILEEHGYEAYIIGGAVRDYLLDRPCQDIDIVTKARPEQIIDLMKDYSAFKVGLVGKAFGVVFLDTPYGNYEVATYRTEVYGADAHRPEVVAYADTLAEDVQRRDFTINALAMNYRGEIIDYVNGEKDIIAKKIRSIGDSVKRFDEDALRLFRLCRFVAQLGFDAEKDMLRNMHQSFKRVAGLSQERVKNEIEKIMLAPHVAKGLDILVRSKLSEQVCTKSVNGKSCFVPILPELNHLVDLPQSPQHHAHDAFLHTLVVVQHTPPDLIIRWGALFHDVAKGLDGIRGYNKGRYTDYGHDKKGAEIAETVLTRFGYKKDFVQRVSWLVKNHMRFHFFAQHDEADVIKWIRKEARSGLFKSKSELVEACTQLKAICVADVIGTGLPHSSTAGTEAFGDCLIEVAKNMPIHTRDLNYEKDIIKLGGNRVGDLLKTLLKQVQDGVLSNDAVSLKEAAEKWLNKMSK